MTATATLRDIIQDITLLIDGGSYSTPVYIWGDPGLGKSSMVQEIANRTGLEVVLIESNLWTPTDIMGLPFLERQEGRQSEVMYAPPKALAQTAGKKRGILFLDEMSSCVPAVQAAWQYIMLNRKVSVTGWELPKEWFIIAAGNFAHNQAGASAKFSTALENRVMHYAVIPDVEGWLVWAMSNDIHEIVVGYIEANAKDKQELLFGFKPPEERAATTLERGKITESIPTMGFASPRSWAQLSNFIRAAEKKFGPYSTSNPKFESMKHTIRRFAESVLGNDAQSFIAWAETGRDLPSTEDILSGKVLLENVPFSGQFMVMSRLIGSMVSRRFPVDRFLALCDENKITREWQLRMLGPIFSGAPAFKDLHAEITASPIWVDSLAARFSAFLTTSSPQKPVRPNPTSNLGSIADLALSGQTIRSNPIMGSVEDAWASSRSAYDLWSICEITGRFTKKGPRQMVHVLLEAYASMYSPAMGSLLKEAVAADKKFIRRNNADLIAKLNTQIAFVRSTQDPRLAIPLILATDMLNKKSNQSVAEMLLRLARFEDNTYPFPRKFMVDLIHHNVPPVTTKELAAAAAKNAKKSGSTSH